MRALFSVFKLILFGIWSLLTIVLGAVLYPFKIDGIMMSLGRFFWSPVVFFIMQTRLKRINFDRVDPAKTYIVMANHNSFMDIPVIFRCIPFNAYFIAKKELGKIPLLGWYIRASGMILIDRTNRIKSNESIAKAAILVAKGKSVMIFPEGTKSRDGKIGPFKKGGFHLAEQSKVPILPIKIEGADYVWPNKKPFQLKRGKITVKYGEPIESAELEEMHMEERAKFVREIIQNL
jgi:1-acyl-sn-glycerol-3-phosphate acyltransferase